LRSTLAPRIAHGAHSREPRRSRAGFIMEGREPVVKLRRQDVFDQRCWPFVESGRKPGPTGLTASVSPPAPYRPGIDLRPFLVVVGTAASAYAGFRAYGEWGGGFGWGGRGLGGYGGVGGGRTLNR